MLRINIVIPAVEGYLNNLGLEKLSLNLIDELTASLRKAETKIDYC